MSNYRDAQTQAHPTKTNTLLLGVICVLILIVSLQIWLLTAALNESLDGQNSVKWPAFWASLALFISGVALLRYLPWPIRRKRGPKPPVAATPPPQNVSATPRRP